MIFFFCKSGKYSGRRDQKFVTFCLFALSVIFGINTFKKSRHFNDISGVNAMLRAKFIYFHPFYTQEPMS